MTYKIPEQPENSFRITLDLEIAQPRLDTVLINALHEQNENEQLSNVSKAHLKRLFTEKKVFIKGQNAKIKSPINKGITYIDIMLS